MDLCGNVYVSKDYSSFSLKCTNCEDIVTKWLEFQKHVKNCLLSKVQEYIELVEEEMPVDEYQPIDPESKYSILETSVVIEPANLATVNIKEEDDDLPLSFLHKTRRGSLAKLNDIKEDFDQEFLDDVPDEEIKDEEPEGLEELDENIYSDPEYDDDVKSASDSCEDNSEDDYVPKTSSRKTANKDDKKFIVSFFRKDQTTGFFIDLYKQNPCLWDSKDENFTSKKAHADARQAMIETIRKKYKLELKETKIKESIDKIRQQYYETRELYIKNPKSNLLKSLAIMHYKRCMFLGEIEKPKLEKEETIKIKRSTKDKDSNFNSKFKIFSRCSKQYIDAFIDIYQRYPELYDRNHANHQNNMLRREIHLKMIEELNAQHGGNGDGADMTLDELITYISSLRHWYYSVTKKSKNAQQPLTDDEQSYYAKCKFLPEYVKQTTITCEHCSSTFKSSINYQKHVYEVHQIGEPYQYKCEHCDRDFPKQTSLSLHIQRHHSGKNFACEFCDRKFSIKADWKLHMRVHTKEKPYICDQCGKAFRLRNQLGNHVTTMHLRERAFKCNMCPKAFYKKVHLTDHIKSHLNIRDKICKTCGKGFTNSHSLGRHRQIHSEIKKFACKLCDARFHQFVGLNSHMKRTHGIFKAKPKEEPTNY